MFERPCFVRPLMLHYHEGGHSHDSAVAGAGSPSVGAGSPSLAASAMERMHGNTHLPQILGAMARYEASGDESLR
eukprot:329651-Prymnesium_polylepis.1